MKKLLFLSCITANCLICSQIFANEESSTNEPQGTENEISSEPETQTNAEKPNSSGEIVLGVVKGICYSAGAGVAAASGNVPGAVGGVIAGSESFIDAAKKYNENVRFEEEMQSDQEKDDYDRSHDHDSWDRDY